MAKCERAMWAVVVAVVWIVWAETKIGARRGGEAAKVRARITCATGDFAKYAALGILLG